MTTEQILSGTFAGREEEIFEATFNKVITNSVDDPSLEEAVDFYQNYVERASANLDRARSLVAVYSDLWGNPGRKTVKKTDLLRAAVVFTDASLEDSLRTLEEVFLPWVDRDKLTKIPIYGSDPRGLQVKFNLGFLVQHKGLTVEELINKSIEEYLSYRSYSSTDQIVKCLKRIDIGVSTIEQYLPTIQKMLDRRHRIVHRADRTDRTGSGIHKAHSISKKEVLKWIDTIKGFLDEITLLAIKRYIRGT